MRRTPRYEKEHSLMVNKKKAYKRVSATDCVSEQRTYGRLSGSERREIMDLKYAGQH